VADPVALVYGDAYREAVYDFGASHPLQPIRVQLAVELMRSAGLLDAAHVTRLDPRLATHQELLAVHDRAYVDAVETLGGAGAVWPELQSLAREHGFLQSDNPVFADMHLAAGLVAGGTTVAAEAVMEGRALHAFAPAGGLHHAHFSRAAGFCIYNDPAVAIAAMRDRHNIRVAYVDVDAHHGDGVQELFYTDPTVLTISMHESGRYLFPGTGFVEEMGAGAARGTSMNVPLEPYTLDEPFLQVIDEVIVPAVQAFKPDLLVTQCGCDSHWLDPLTHLATTTRIWPAIAQRFHALAHEVCEGRWLATGGGGYDLYSVVPRAWTLLFAEMAEQPLPEALPDEFLALRRRYSSEAMSGTFLDHEELDLPAERQAAILAATRRTMQRVQSEVFPLLMTHI
jgi:acetoin utilization protein AcuC